MKPMLACSVIPDIDSLKYPVIASPKLDGIRCVIKDGRPLSRTLKSIPNDYVHSVLSSLDLPELDGEIMVKGDFNDVQSAIMSRAGKPMFEYHVFDSFTEPNKPFEERYNSFKYLPMFSDMFGNCLKLVEQVRVENAEQMRELLDKWLDQGYEGAIVRDPKGPYKFGRSTLNQGYMLKLKVFEDDEAKIVGVQELLDVNGVPQDTLGALVTMYKGVQLKVGTGFDAATRRKLWATRNKLVGLDITFKYQGLSRYGVPRFPVFKWIRYERTEATN